MTVKLSGPSAGGTDRPVTVLWRRDKLALIEDEALAGPYLVDVDRLVYGDEGPSPAVITIPGEEYYRLKGIEMMTRVGPSGVAAADEAGETGAGEVGGGCPVITAGYSPLERSKATDGADPSMAIIPREDHERLIAIEELARRAVIEEGDQLCWRDLYEGLGKLLGTGFDPRLMIRSGHLANCAHFIDCLYENRNYDPPFAATWDAAQCEAFWRAIIRWFQAMDTIFRTDGGRGQEPKQLFSVMRCWREAFQLAGSLDHLGLPKVTAPRTPEGGGAKSS